jgi:hypothetical protein
MRWAVPLSATERRRVRPQMFRGSAIISLPYCGHDRAHGIALTLLLPISIFASRGGSLRRAGAITPS